MKYYIFAVFLGVAAVTLFICFKIVTNSPSDALMNPQLDNAIGMEWLLTAWPLLILLIFGVVAAYAFYKLTHK